MSALSQPISSEMQCAIWTRTFALAFALVAITFAIYWPAIHHDFVDYDDGLYVVGNSRVQAGLTWEGVKWAVRSGEAGNWHPVTWLSHMLDVGLFGRNAGGHHLTNVVVHCVNVALLFLVLRRMTGGFWPSLLVAALFALHPLRVESVAWVSERKDVLCGFFFMLSLWAYAAFVERVKVQSPASGIFYAASLLSFALGLMSKPMLVTLPFVLLLLDCWPLRRVEIGPRLTRSDFRQLGRLVKEKIPFFGLSAASCVVTFLVQRKGGAVFPMSSLSMTERLSNSLLAYAAYLRKTLWPDDLAVLYPLFLGPRPAWELVGAGLMLLLITTLFAWYWRKFPFLLIGWLWYLGTLVPVIGLVQVGSHFMADRYTYIPLIGLFICITYGTAEVVRRWPATKFILGVAGLVALILCAAATRAQIAHWATSETLFRRAVTVTPNNWLMHNSLGGWLMHKGRVAEAVEQFQAALRIHPNYQEARYNLGIALVRLGRLDEGISEYNSALRLRPDHTDAHVNLGAALAAKKQLDAALEHFQTALRLDPSHADAWNNAANVLSEQGRRAEAVDCYQRALQFRPAFPEAHFNCGVALEQVGQRERAIYHLREALRLKPDHEPAENHLRKLLHAQPPVK